MRALLLSLLCACGGGSTTDAGRIEIDGGSDAGKADAGREPDAGRDAGTIAIDAGRDAGAVSSGVCDVDLPCRGACQGAGCDDLAWTCSPIGCSGDSQTFCGCDGVEFYGSSTCPSRPWSHMGPCDDRLVNCDPRDALCFETPAPCREGMARVVRRDTGCWGDCVRIDRCTCTEDDACPFAGDVNRCDVAGGHCEPI